MEEYINRLGQDLIPLAERCSRIMREALAALETLRAGSRSALSHGHAGRKASEPTAPQLYP